MTRANIFICCTLLFSVWAVLPQRGFAQTPANPSSAGDLPAAPQPQFTQNPSGSVALGDPQVALVASFPRQAGLQTPSSPAPQAVPAPQTPGGPMHLNRTEAEQL